MAEGKVTKVHLQSMNMLLRVDLRIETVLVYLQLSLISHNVTKI